MIYYKPCGQSLVLLTTPILLLLLLLINISRHLALAALRMPGRSACGNILAELIR